MQFTKAASVDYSWKLLTGLFITAGIQSKCEEPINNFVKIFTYILCVSEPISIKNYNPQCWISI